MKKELFDFMSSNDVESLKKIIIQQSRDIKKYRFTNSVLVVYTILTLVIMLYNRYA